MYTVQLTAHWDTAQVRRRRRLSRVFHGLLLHFMSISEHFRVWASVPVRVQGFRAPHRSSPKGKRGKKVSGEFIHHHIS